MYIAPLSARCFILYSVNQTVTTVDPIMTKTVSPLQFKLCFLGQIKHFSEYWLNKFSIQMFASVMVRGTFPCKFSPKLLHVVTASYLYEYSLHVSCFQQIFLILIFALDFFPVSQFQFSTKNFRQINSPGSSGFWLNKLPPV